MSLFDAAAQAIGEGVAYVIGRIIGRGFDIGKNTAQHIGEYVAIGLLLGAGIVVTIFYS